MQNVSEYWLREIVIGLDLCPFAKVPYQKGLIRISENELTVEEDQFSFFLDELENLQSKSNSELSTTLVVFKNGTQDFLDFNDFVGVCEDVIDEANLNEHFQLVVFHPKYYQEGRDFDDRANLVGRSPYPTIHILRNADIEMARESTLNLEEIPEKNESKLSLMTNIELQKLFYFL